VVFAIGRKPADLAAIEPFAVPKQGLNSQEKCLLKRKPREPDSIVSGSGSRQVKCNFNSCKILRIVSFSLAGIEQTSRFPHKKSVLWQKNFQCSKYCDVAVELAVARFWNNWPELKPDRELQPRTCSVPKKDKEFETTPGVMNVWFIQQEERKSRRTPEQGNPSPGKADICPGF